MATLSIRRMTEADQPLAAALMERSISLLMSGHYPSQTLRLLISRNRPEDILERSSKQQDYLAFSGEQAVGYLGIKKNEIGHLFVEPDAAGHGVGAALVAFAEARFREGGHANAMVLASLNALTFYERHGFRRVSEGSFEVGPGVPLNHVRMEKELRSPPKKKEAP